MGPIIWLTIYLLLFTLLLEKKRIANLATIVASFTFSLGISFLTVSITQVIAFVFRLPPHHLVTLILMDVLYLLGGLFAYRKLKARHERTKTKQKFAFLKAKETQRFVYAAGVIVYSFYLFFSITEMVDLTDSTQNMLIIALITILLGALYVAGLQAKQFMQKLKIAKLATLNIGLQIDKTYLQEENTIYQQTVSYLRSEREKQTAEFAELEAEAEDVKLENVSLQVDNHKFFTLTERLAKSNFAMFFKNVFLNSALEQEKQENALLTKEAEELSAEFHTTKKAIPSVLRVFDDLETISTEPELRKEIKIRREDLTRSYGCAQRAESAGVQQDMPKTAWRLLNNLLDEYNERAAKERVALQVFMIEDVAKLDEMNIPELSMVKVIADHMSNSFRELTKLDNDKVAIIRLFFKKRADGYAFELFDNAPEFPAEIMAGLGKRGVSTSGSGHGFANTLKTIAPLGASLIVKEYVPFEAHDCNKSITIQFDNLGQFEIESYRADFLQTLTQGARAKIKPIYRPGGQKLYGG